MSGWILRAIVIAVIVGAVLWGLRKIWRDWTGAFKQAESEADARRRARDLAERKLPGIIDLKRGEDGTFRPGGKDDDSRI